jgi:hypothetical protein
MLITLMILLPSIACAESTQTKSVLATTDKISGLYNSLSGKTVTMRGAIGTKIGDQLYFKNDHGQFKVQFDAGRAARKKIEGCKIEWIGWKNSKCLHEVDAEIKLDGKYSLSDGIDLDLIVYEIR